MAVDISSIPLPSDESYNRPKLLKSIIHDNLHIPVEDITDIPLPPAGFDALDIPLPPPHSIESIELPTHFNYDTNPDDHDDHSEADPSGPLKFSLKIQNKSLSGQDPSNEPSGVFESSKDLKTDEPKSMPKLQAMMKRSKPSQLPVGVLPSKVKLPASEIKTELFLPAKDSDVNGTNMDDSKSLAPICLLPGPSLLPSVEPLELPKEINSLLPEVHTAPISIGSMNTDVNSLRLETPSTLFPGISSLAALSNMTAIPPSTAHIPNLMSLTVSPVQTVPTLPPVATAISAESAAVLRQSKMNMANMQYVNPQKLRSAQMIATPLIANPALATQAHHKDDLSRSRRRSRSRSRRRSSSSRNSTPERRGRRRHSSSSSSPSPPRRRYQRRSRSRRSSEERYTRGQNFPRDRERRWERPIETDNRRSFRNERGGDKRQSVRRSPSPRDNKRPFRPSDAYERSQRDKPSRRTPEKKKDDRNDRKTSKDDTSNARKPRDERKSPLRSDRHRLDVKVPPKESTKRETVSRDVRKERPTRLNEDSKKPSAPKHLHETSGSETDSSGSSRSRSPKRKPSPRSNSKKHPKSPVGSNAASGESTDSSPSRPTDKSHERKRHNSHRQNSPPNSTDRKSELKRPKDATLDIQEDESLVAFRENTTIEVPIANVTTKPIDTDVSLCVDDVQTSEVSPPIQESVAFRSMDKNEVAEIETDSSTGESPINLQSPGGVSSGSESKTTTSPTSVSSIAISNSTPEKPHSTVTKGKYDLRERKSNRTSELQHLQSLLTSLQLRISGPAMPSMDVFSSYPGAPKPEYVHIVNNDYSRVAHCSNSTAAAGAKLLGSVGSVVSSSGREMRQWVCDCTMPSLEELGYDLLPCGPGCINRALNIECGSSCPAGKFCSNRQFQERLYAPAEPFYSGPGKGWGLHCTTPVSKNTFIIEYVGEVIDFAEFRRRVRRYERIGHAHHYFMALESDRFIDAGSNGNWARFVNHSCEPNCVTQKWSVNGELRIGFFVKEDLAAGDEITIDYQFVQFGATEQKCYCNTPSCSGVMGSTNKNLQEKVRLKDTSMVERRVLQLLETNSFHRADEITLLLQVLVQECLTRYTRMELLKRLTATDSLACLKLFRQYNGLDMLAALMCDSATDDWELKRQILFCLDNVPVSEQNQVQSNSRLMDIVSQWTIDPHFCRSRGTGMDESETNGGTPTNDTLRPLNGTTTDAEQHSNILPQTNDAEQHSNILPQPDDAEQHSNVLPQTNDAEQQSNILLQTDDAEQHSNILLQTNDAEQHPNILPQTTTIYSTESLSPDSIAADAEESINHPVTPPEVSSPSIAISFAPAADRTPTMITRSSSSALMAMAKPCTESRVLEVSIPEEPTDSPIAIPVTPPDMPPEEEYIEQIRLLASTLIEKWLKLPKENYRIPRTERQETEKELHVGHSSSLVSWGHNDELQGMTASWGQSKANASNDVRSKRSGTGSTSRASSSNCDMRLHEASSKLSKVERRKLFEAQVIAAEEKMKVFVTEQVENKSESDSKTNSDELAVLYQLILCCALNELKKTKSDSIPTQLDDPESPALMNSLMNTLPQLLSKVKSDSKELKTLNRLLELMTKQTDNSSSHGLPSDWQSAVDPSGRTYYYNMSNKLVQWERPTNDEDNNGSVNSTPVDKDTTISAEEAEKLKAIEKSFTVEVGKFIHRLLKPYRLPNCLTGRIVTDSDLIHLTRKFTHAFVSKELKQKRIHQQLLVLTEPLQERIRSSLTRYMTSRGKVYKRKDKKLKI